VGGRESETSGSPTERETRHGDKTASRGPQPENGRTTESPNERLSGRNGKPGTAEKPQAEGRSRKTDAQRRARTNDCPDGTGNPARR